MKRTGRPPKTEWAQCLAPECSQMTKGGARGFCKRHYQQHRKELEANTETKLVEPLFAILGWTTKDFEKRAHTRRGMGAGFVDYAFKINNKIAFYLEVKKLGVPLEREADTQVISYALSRTNVPFAISTNKVFFDLPTSKQTFI